jgi:hypothetical protein
MTLITPPARTVIIVSLTRPNFVLDQQTSENSLHGTGAVIRVLGSGPLK